MLPSVAALLAACFDRRNPAMTSVLWYDTRVIGMYIPKTLPDCPPPPPANAIVQPKQMLAERASERTADRSRSNLTYDAVVEQPLQMHISFQLLCRHYLQSLKPADLENSSDRTGLVAESCLLSEVVADAVGKSDRLKEQR